MDILLLAAGFPGGGRLRGGLPPGGLGLGRRGLLPLQALNQPKLRVQQLAAGAAVNAGVLIHKPAVGTSF